MGISELVGDLLLGSPVDEDGAEGLVAAVPGPGGAGEEVVAAGVVHRQAPDVSFFRVGIRLAVQFMGELVSGSRAPNDWLAHDLKGDLGKEVRHGLFPRSAKARHRHRGAR
jgi:hypothetical protein